MRADTAACLRPSALEDRMVDGAPQPLRYPPCPERATMPACEAGPGDRATGGNPGVRKVRAPQGRMLANGQAGRPDGKCRRKEDSHLRASVKGKAETVV